MESSDRPPRSKLLSPSLIHADDTDAAFFVRRFDIQNSLKSGDNGRLE